ncbi:MAG: amino acid permease, partial [Polyangiaceae bacterium]|nr:amino acid permease [Polyangiaceae bacterium]
MTRWRQLLQTKPLDGAPESGEPTGLRRVLGATDLLLLGVGAIIGTGIFASIGAAYGGDESRPGAGPAVVVSFVLTA